MKNTLILLAVATAAATLSGCAACCPTGLAGGLCPCCPFTRPAPACPPPPTYAPVCPPVAACPPAAPPCVAWDPCQCAVVPRPGAAGAFAAPPAFAQAPQVPQMGSPFAQAPPYGQMQPQFPMSPTYYTEPNCGCGYVETSCGMPYMGSAGYGPSMPVEYGMAGACCAPGGMGTPTQVVPGPGE